MNIHRPSEKIDDQLNNELMIAKGDLGASRRNRKEMLAAADSLLKRWPQESDSDAPWRRITVSRYAKEYVTLHAAKFRELSPETVTKLKEKVETSKAQASKRVTEIAAEVVKVSHAESSGSEAYTDKISLIVRKWLIELHAIFRKVRLEKLDPETAEAEALMLMERVASDWGDEFSSNHWQYLEALQEAADSGREADQLEQVVAEGNATHKKREDQEAALELWKNA